MIIGICSQSAAINAIRTAKSETSVISITSTDDPDVAFPDNPKFVSVLHLKCNDLTKEYDEDGFPYGRPLPRPEDFEKLKAFVDGLAIERPERLIVHCWEGTSRSAAVAKAVFEYRGSQDTVEAQQPLSPNPLVYRLARRALMRK